MKSFVAMRRWLGSIWLLALIVSPSIEAEDVTERLVDLGNKPAESRQRGVSRNLWDLQLFDGKIYLGMGSTVDDRGPIPVWAYDHAARRWNDAPETIVDLEAIELYRVIDGQLYIPAADPKEKATEGSKFYRRRTDGQWAHMVSVRPLHTAHIRDLAGASGSIIGVGNSRDPHRMVNAKPSAIAISTRMIDTQPTTRNQIGLFRSAISLEPPGQSGGRVDADTSQRNRVGNWLFSVFQLHDGLYASTRWLSWASDNPEPVGLYAPRPEYPPQVPPFPTVLRWEPSLQEFAALPADELDRLVPESPDRDPQTTLRPFKPTLFGELWFAPLRSYSLTRAGYQSLYNMSADFVVKPADGPGLRVTLPNPDALGEAVVVDDDQLYVLSNARQASGDYRVAVYALTLADARAERLNADSGLDKTAWREVLYFTSTNLARSFAKVNSTWYFGLGMAFGEAAESAGALLRLD